MSEVERAFRRFFRKTLCVVFGIAYDLNQERAHSSRKVSIQISARKCAGHQNKSTQYHIRIASFDIRNEPRNDQGTLMSHSFISWRDQNECRCSMRDTIMQFCFLRRAPAVELWLGLVFRSSFPAFFSLFSILTRVCVGIKYEPVASGLLLFFPLVWWSRSVYALQPRCCTFYVVVCCVLKRVRREQNNFSVRYDNLA